LIQPFLGERGGVPPQGGKRKVGSKNLTEKEGLKVVTDSERFSEKWGGKEGGEVHMQFEAQGREGKGI